MEDNPNGDEMEPLQIWEAKTHIDYIRDRENNLLTLRYQLAFVILSMIVGIWTILVGFTSQIIEKNGRTDITFIFYFGLFTTISLIIGWRIITHFISFESNGLQVARLKRLSDLKLIDKDNGHFILVEEKLKLKEYGGYCVSESILSFSQKLSIIEKLQNWIPDSGIFLFDIIAAICLWILLIIGLIYNKWEIANLAPVPTPNLNEWTFLLIILSCLFGLGIYFVGYRLYQRRVFKLIIESVKNQ
jgi:hypothetical protein